MVEIKGIEKFAPKDFPGYISATVFLGGCNFRCPYCHNSDLVLRPAAIPTIPLEEFIAFIEERRGWLEGLCISGGEPLLHEDIEDFLRLIKERNLLVKVDTNGSFPSRLERLIQEMLIDVIAMDVKASLCRYQEVTRSNVSVEDIERSIRIIRSSGLRHEFRTTVVPGLVGIRDLEDIGRMLNGARIFQIQQFFPRNTVESLFLEVKPFSREEIFRFAELLKPYFGEVRVEGI